MDLGMVKIRPYLIAISQKYCGRGVVMRYAQRCESLLFWGV